LPKAIVETPNGDIYVGVDVNPYGSGPDYQRRVRVYKLDAARHRALDERHHSHARVTPSHS